MAFIPLPVYSTNLSDEQIELKEDLKQEIEYDEGTMWVNTAHITDFLEQENGYVMIYLSNGRGYTVLLQIEEFLDMLSASEAMIDLTDIKDN